MSILCWNCRGIGNQRTIQELQDVVNSKKPSLIFLSETLITHEKVDRIKRAVGYHGHFIVASQGHSGGLLLLWKEKNMCNLVGFNNNFIDVLVHAAGVPMYRFSGFYGYPERNRRRQSWELLKSLKRQPDVPWCIAGDFNDIMWQDEKYGRVHHPNWLVNGFRAAVVDSGLFDLGYYGHRFTWDRGRGTNDWVSERLDRALANPKWLTQFPDAKVHNLDMVCSDHDAIYVQLGVEIIQYVPRGFRFENAWLQEDDLREVVHKAWGSETPQPLKVKMQRCTDSLMRWGEGRRNMFKEKLRSCKQQMSRFRTGRDNSSVQLYRTAMDAYRIILNQQEAYWRQRSKQTWLREGDANTKFYHNMASRRRRKNELVRLKNELGEWVNWNSGMEELIDSYFQKLFESEQGDCDTVLGCIKIKIGPEQNAELLKPFVAEEVKEALFAMHPDKASGPDGYNPAFYQQFWTIVGDDITRECLNVVNNDGEFPGGNNTNIVLIPKKNTPEYVSDLRPISLCNVLDKVIAKMLANRLKQLLATIISESQSAFIPDRLITDNTMIAFEVLHSIRRKKQGKTGFMAFKTDMSKAYDRVEWSFLQRVMLKLGFAQRWVDKVMRLVTTVTYTVCNTRHKIGPIFPKRGIRQGDPLSPYLFIMCAEALSSMLSSFEEKGQLHGYKVVPRAPSISHLFFADDALYFTRATTQDAFMIKHCLELYQKASGQKVNLSKSELVFSSNTPDELQETISNMLGVSIVPNFNQYLGLPTVVGRSKKEVFQFVHDKIWKRLNGWKGVMLSRAGKEVLLKTVIQAIPNYLMSLFLLPKHMCESIEKLMNKFWWRNAVDSASGIHWASWSKMTQSKDNGGLGFRKLYEFNKALLAKQGWRFLMFPDSLVARLYKAIYFREGDFMSASEKANQSYIWRSILAGRDILRLGCLKRIGKGDTISVFDDPWIPTMDSMHVSSLNTSGMQSVMVSDLFVPNCREWDLEVLPQLFSEDEVAAIRCIRLPASALEDGWMWKWDNKGVYTVKSGYEQASKLTLLPQQNQSIWHWIWNLQVPPKMKNFVWRLGHDLLPVLTKLRQRKVVELDLCPVCRRGEESVLHRFVTCPFAVMVWNMVGVASWNGCMSIVEWLSQVQVNFSSEKWSLMICVAWQLWFSRNKLIWDNKTLLANDLVWHAKRMVAEWAEVHKTHGCRNIQRTEAHWKPPWMGSVKCNIDTSFDPNTKLARVGCCIRDSHGKWMMGFSKSIGPMFNPLMAEVMGLWEVLSWLKVKNGGLHIELELDSLLVVNAIKSKRVDLSYFGMIIIDCKAHMSDLGIMSCLWTRRSANQCANELAKPYDSMPDCVEWRDVPPTFILSILASDAQ